MLRNILRTSRWLIRRQINKVTAVTAWNLTENVIIETPLVGVLRNHFSSSPTDSQPIDHVDPAVFEEVCNETLESLCEYFEEIIDQSANLKGADVTFSDGVLTVTLGSKYGTYVINRQTPNKQIWLSSPVSGPKRYDLILKSGGYWIYKHNGQSLHQLLQIELVEIMKDVDFKNCSHSLV